MLIFIFVLCVIAGWIIARPVLAVYEKLATARQLRKVILTSQMRR